MRVVEEIDDWPVRTAAVALASADAIVDQHGAVDQPLAVASLTKVLVAMAVWVAVEEGSLDFDQPAGPDGSTVAHLLAHASGMGPDDPGPLAAVGSRRIYSNAGFELLGKELSEATDMPVETYLTEAVIGPLGLAHTELRGSPAHGAWSSVSDLVKVGHELLSPTLVHATTLAQATRPFLADLAGILPGFGPRDPNPWGLGVEIRGHKSPHWTAPTASPTTFGHFGRSGGYLWVDPDRQLATAVLTDQEFGPWAIDRWPSFNERLMGC